MGNNYVKIFSYFLFNIFFSLEKKFFSFQCCKNNSNINEKKNELNTEKKRNGKIITDNENIDETHNLKLFPKMKKLETENNSNIFETEKKEEEKKKIEKIKSKILIIEVISSIIPIGEILRIGPTGLENGKRNAKDGVTYFGYEEEAEDNVKYFYNFIVA